MEIIPRPKEAAAAAAQEEKVDDDDEKNESEEINERNKWTARANEIQ